MLDGLDRIDWESLTHAYGSAGDVPGLLSDLLSDDEGAREEAIHELHGNIYHQGSRYQASAYAVPFLLEMLADLTTILAWDRRHAPRLPTPRASMSRSPRSGN